MDADALLDWTRRLVEAPSPSGGEVPGLAVAEELLREAGLETSRQPVGGGERWNLLARRGRPRAVLTTHVDTVPDPMPVRREGDVLYGRGACDAKGCLAAMIAAAADLASRGAEGFGVAVVVGEETTSDGAVTLDSALAAGELDWPCEAGLVGEPTGNRWVSAHPGVLVARATARGRPAHSAYPEEGDSAVHRLLAFLEAALRWEWPEDPVLGPTRLNVGRVSGGTAANVVASEAEASLMVRSGAPAAEVEAALRRLAGERIDLEVTCSSEPMRFAVPEGAEDAGPVSFSTDAPFLPHLGRIYLLGPGSIRDAHTREERVRGKDLVVARNAYVDWVTARLTETAGQEDP